MSSFIFHLWNHSKLGKSSLDDVIGIMGHQLRALGHLAIHDPRNESDAHGNIKPDIGFAHGPDQYNVIVEGFTPGVIEIIARARKELGAKFICVATEEPTEKGFNHGTQKEMVMRQDTFVDAAQHFEGILHLVPGKRVTDWYSQFAPTAYAELGYAPTLKRVPQIRTPTFDFAFFGSVTPRRYSLLKRLAKRTSSPNAVRIVSTFPEQIERDRMTQEAKVILQIRKFDEMGLVSSSRCNTALCCGRPVVAEPHDVELSKPWDEIVRFTASEEDFITHALLMRSMWASVHSSQFDKFKEKLPPEVCVGDPMRKIGIFPKMTGRIAA